MGHDHTDERYFNEIVEFANENLLKANIEVSDVNNLNHISNSLFILSLKICVKYNPSYLFCFCFFSRRATMKRAQMI